MEFMWNAATQKYSIFSNLRSEKPGKYLAKCNTYNKKLGMLNTWIPSCFLTAF